MKTWSEYYTLCKSKYEGNKSATVYDLGLEVLGDQINFDENFYSTVSRLSKGVKESILENHETQANAKSVKSTKNFISDILVSIKVIKFSHDAKSRVKRENIFFFPFPPRSN